MRLKAGGKLQGLRVEHFCNFSIAMRSEGSDWLVEKIFFNEHPEKMLQLHIKLQECTVIAIYSACARS
jgi:hypothetical protein